MNRQEKRSPLKIRWPITVVGGKAAVDGYTRNITEAGMLILSNEPLRLYESYKITVRLPSYLDRVLACKVVWSDLYGIDPNDHVYGIGYCFVQVSQKDRTLLSHMVSEFNRN
ncbi:MAG: PilZ domain-containing protein [Desulfobacteraceae bacterium]|nr:MAG: PilZ domain-containing protein [Desulfobacteraceae bacterium]